MSYTITGVKPLLSVIIPAHNEEQDIAMCLAHIVKQSTNVPYEIIVVDNNCTDETVAIAKSFNVRIVQEKSPGAAAARNKGVREAKSDLFVFIDADCHVKRDHLAIIHSLFQQDPSLAVAGGVYDYFDGSWFVRTTTKNGWIFLHYTELLKVLFGYYFFVGGNMAVRKNAYNAVGGYRADIKDSLHDDDVELSMRLAVAGYKTKLVPQMTTLSLSRRVTNFKLREAWLRNYWLMYHMFAYRLPFLRFPKLAPL